MTPGEPAPTIADVNASSTTLTMTASDVAVTATYKDLPTYVMTVNGGSGGGNYFSGENVSITADPAPSGKEFDHWDVAAGDSVPTIADVSASSTTLTMSGSAATVTATYKYRPKYVLTVDNGTGDSSYFAGTPVIIKAATAPPGQEFNVWVKTSGNPDIADLNVSTTTLMMPANDVTVTARFKNIKYVLTVNKGSGGGNYEDEEVANIIADDAPSGKEFDKWEVDSGDPQPSILDVNASSTTLTMKASAATVTATYRGLPIANAGDDMTVGNYKITLDGSGCSDAGTGELSYSWKFVSQPDNSIIGFDDGTLRMSSFTPDAAGKYVIELIVSNGISDSAPDTVTVTVIPDVSNTLGMEFKSIQGGTFTMGDDDNGPVHNVTLTQSFYMQTTEVTQEQWESVLDQATSMSIGTGELSKTPSYVSGETNPVEQASWDDVKNFIGILNQLGEGAYRLPTEAEWEYACRSGSTTNYANGDDESDLALMGWYGGNSGDTTHPVAQKAPNAWGLFDMLGNVREWCEDWYDIYPPEDVTDPTGSSTGSSRVSRGGSWNDSAQYCRVANRGGNNPGNTGYNLGFRLVRIPDVYNTFGMKFNSISGGTFTMGDADSTPIHNVTLTQPFYMQTTEVTQEQWKSILDKATSMSIGTGDLDESPSGFQGNKNPVEQVSWDDVKNFIEILNQLGEGAYRLPTEAEWEYSCRSGSITKYANGDYVSDLEEMGWHSGNSEEATHPVAGKAPNAWGLFDMHGNVWEWCEDWYGSYPSEDVTDPTGSSADTGRVVRGGSGYLGESACRSASRRWYTPDSPNYSLGFRLTRAP